MHTQDRFRGCLLGLAVGDAVGTAVEFRPRGSFAPLTDMVGGGPFHLEPGQWTDDTSMALCLATSLVERGWFDARDQMERYCRWADEGYLSSNGTCFDIGNTVSAALRSFRRTGEPFSGSTDPRSAGNGCLMRLAPIPMFYANDVDAAVHYATESARTTHGAEECLEASRLFARITLHALSGAHKDDLAMAGSDMAIGSSRIAAIARGAYLDKTEAEIKGSGYVVASLEAAMWCFVHTDSFRDAILKAANLGDDADTTAAICGQVAGAYYGESGIPAVWLEKLAMRREVSDLADRLLAGARSASQ